MITFENVSKTYPGGVRAVDDLSFSMDPGETLVLVGRSGSGKTTAMRMINRLIEPSGGRILVDGRDVMDRDPIALRRMIGYAIQHIGLFPHLTIAANIAVVPRLLGWDAARIDARVRALVEMVGLGDAGVEHRYPTQLSGGQRQRIGVARALAADPPIVLMDEPFGALDPITREQLQDEFLGLGLDKTLIFVTHDIFEAVKMGDRIALLEDGRLLQLGTPSDLVEHPANDLVERFLGQHRFQLTLMTRTVDGLMTAGPPAPPDPAPAVQRTDSLVAALDRFKQNRCDRLTVLDQGRPAGTLTRDAVVAAMTEALRS